MAGKSVSVNWNGCVGASSSCGSHIVLPSTVQATESNANGLPCGVVAGAVAGWSASMTLPSTARLVSETLVTSWSMRCVVQLAPLSRDREAARDAPHADRLLEHAERPVDDGDLSVVLERDVEPAWIARVPHGRPRMPSDRNDSPEHARAGLDEPYPCPRAIDRCHPGTVRAQCDAPDVLPDLDLLEDLLRAVVDADEADRADIAVRGPDELSHRVEGDRRGGGVDALCQRDERGRCVLQGGGRAGIDVDGASVVSRAIPPASLERASVHRSIDVARIAGSSRST